MEEQLMVGLDTLWVLLAAFLVFFMQAGFALLEAGFIRARNTTNVLMKNLIDFAAASVIYFVLGYALMFGEGNPIFGTNGFFMENATNPSGIPLYAFLLFQTAFAGAAATIVSGTMAERTKFTAYLLYTVVISALFYPLIGHWVWGGGWLAELGFADFAGSTVVHLTGGAVAFVGALLLGARKGKFNPDGSANTIPGHSIPLAALGAFILWFGWFGFNPGSTLSVGDGSSIALIALNTNLAAAIGAVMAMITVWLKSGKPDLGMTLNGALAGLVAITAPCAFVSPASALLIGAVGGVLVVYAVDWVNALKVDDPVGAVAVHGFNGAWGTLAIGLLGRESLGVASEGLLFGGGFAQLGVQALGVVSVAAFCLIGMGLVFKLIDATVGLRVSEEEELQGLDLHEHGAESYDGFEMAA